MFLDDNYLLGNAASRRIFDAIRDLPIIDMHNHADVKSIAANDKFSGAWQLFGATDHYVWEVMRKAGVPENLITGDASDHDKFMALAGVFDDLAGNPVYEWIHLDLRFLGIGEVLSAATGEQILREVNSLLELDENRPQELLKRMKVELMCSTDDPLDELLEHDAARSAMRGFCEVRPTWRPDRAMKIQAPDFAEYVEKLARRFDTPIKCIDCFLGVLQKSHDYFAARGCLASDHGMTLAAGGAGDKELAQATFAKRRRGEEISVEEAENFAGFMLGEFGEMNVRSNWITQLHIGAVRDVRRSLFSKLGADSGGDVSDIFQNHGPKIASFLNRFDGRLDVVLYCLDPAHQATLAALSRAFGERVRLGSAWWLCDTPVGMKRQLEYIASVDLLSNFAGMVSDSRKLLSYGSRFGMFRRVLSDVLGEMVEKGRMPEEVALRLAVKMCRQDYFLERA